MRSTLNFTGRRTLSINGASPDCTLQQERIDASRFRVRVSVDASVCKGMEAGTRVYCEAWYRNRFQRVEAGTVDVPPLAMTVKFDRVPSDIARLRLKLVNNAGKIVAVSPTITSSTTGPESDSESLLGLREIPELDAPWRVDVSPEERPVLLVHAALGLRERILTDPLVQRLVLPAALRDIGLRYLLMSETERDADDWCRRFFQFAEEVSGQAAALPDSPADGGDPAQIDTWIDDFVGAFCRQHDMLRPLETLS